MDDEGEISVTVYTDGDVNLDFDIELVENEESEIYDEDGEPVELYYDEDGEYDDDGEYDEDDELDDEYYDYDDE